MRRLSDKKVLVPAFAIAIFILTLMGALAYRNTRHLIANDRWVIHTYGVIERLKTLSALLTDAEAGRRGYIITGEERYLDPYHRAREAIEGEFEALRQLTSDDADEQRRLKELQPLVNEHMRLLSKSIDIRKSSGLDAATQSFLTDKSKALMDEIRLRIREMEEEEDKLLLARKAVTQASGQRTLRMLILGTIGSFSLLLLFFLFLTREISRRREVEADLKAAHDHLELRVEERTSQLALANTALQEKIAERIRAERLLRDSQALFQTLANVSPVGIFRTDAHGHCTYVNKRWCQIAGIPAEQAIADH